jgi:tetratricopeptide (TPR) repeat protein
MKTKIFIWIFLLLFIYATPLFSYDTKDIYCPYCGNKITEKKIYCSNCTIPTKRIFKQLEIWDKISNKNPYELKKIKPILNNKLSKQERKIKNSLLNKSEISFNEKKYKGCENFARAALKIDKNSFEAYYLIAESYFGRTDYKKTTFNIVESLKINPLYKKSILLGKKLIKINQN